MLTYQSTLLMTMMTMKMPKENRSSQAHLRVLQVRQDPAPDLDQDQGPDLGQGLVLVEDLRRAIQDLGPGNGLNR